MAVLRALLLISLVLACVWTAHAAPIVIPDSVLSQLAEFAQRDDLRTQLQQDPRGEDADINELSREFVQLRVLLSQLHGATKKWQDIKSTEKLPQIMQLMTELTPSASATYEPIAAPAASAQPTCDANGARTECGFGGITEQQCRDKGCCHMPGNGPWCFHPNGAAPAPSAPATAPSPASQKWFDELMMESVVSSLPRDRLVRDVLKSLEVVVALNKPIHEWQQKIRDKMAKRRAEAEAKNAQPPAPKEPEAPVSCGDFLSCDSCLAKGCAWCLGERVCVNDDVWMCQGQEDQVGLRVGQHKQCPDPMEAEKRARRRREEAEREEAEQAQLRAAVSEATAAGLSAADADALANKKLGCVAWRQTGGCNPDGPRESAADLACDQPINSERSGFCECTEGVKVAASVCGHDSFTCEERCSNAVGARLAALAKAKEVAASKAASELLRLRAEIQDGSAASTESIFDDDELEKMKQQRRDDIKRRAQASKSKETSGMSRPYETLGVERSATQAQIRRRYHHLSLELHPDKNQELPAAEVEAAFSDLVAAYEIIGNAEKRAEFDTTGGGRGEGFFTQEEWMQSGQKDMRGFYAGNPYITQLTEKLWDRRIVGDQVWLVEFYAPWCSACMQFAPTFKALAERLRDEETVAVGAVNCAVEQHLCGSVFNIRAYPTIRLISKRHGTQQEFGDAHARGVESIATWAKEIADEWKWLFSRANLTEFETEEAFQQQVIASSEFWIVLFSDGAECSSCKTAKTNMMRLSAGLLSMARVGFFNCLASHEARAFCSQRDLPASPFAPQVRAFQSGAKHADDKGEMLYSPSEIEPHYALQLIERVLRLSQTPEQRAATEAQAREGGWDKGIPDKKSDSPSPAPAPRPRPHWNGPKGRATLAAGGHRGGGGGNMFMLR